MRRPRRCPARDLPGPETPGDQPGALARGRRDQLHGALPLPARTRAFAFYRRFGRIRGGAALRRACQGGRLWLRADGRERRRGGAALQQAGRHPARHRARGGQDEGSDRRADPREARGPTGAADHGQPHGRRAPQDAQGDPPVELRPPERGRAGVVPAALGVRRGLGPGGGRGRRGREGGGGRATAYWICSRSWWTNRLWWSRRMPRALCATGCSNRSGSSRANKLRESGEEAEVRRRHAGHYLALAEKAEPELLGPDQGLWLRRLRSEFANLREAHSWSLEPGQEEERARLRLRLPAALWRFWGGQRFEEGKRWLQTALEKDTGGFPAVRARRSMGSALSAFPARLRAGDRRPRRGHRPLRGSRRQSGAAFALANLGYAVLHGGYHEACRRS